jgi:hypothetical protein
MKRFPVVISLLAGLALLTGACGGPDLMASGDVCQDAAQHTAACLGETTPSGAVSCDAGAAQDLLDKSCDQIQLGVAGKADWVDILASLFTWKTWGSDEEDTRILDCKAFFVDWFACNKSCESGDTCHSSLACVNGKCTNPTCATDEDCYPEYASLGICENNVCRPKQIPTDD